MPHPQLAPFQFWLGGFDDIQDALPIPYMAEVHATIELMREIVPGAGRQSLSLSNSVNFVEVPAGLSEIAFKQLDAS
ncbi:MAG TPA: hypothetical protein VMZ90_02950 [Vicinamibacterales bacterium]|nr:hypothetical protein [Vicinamibacterales bacterium]